MSERRLFSDDEIRQLLETIDVDNGRNHLRDPEDNFEGSDEEGEEERIETNDHDSNPEDTPDDDVDVDITDMYPLDDNFRFYIGKDTETLWCSAPVVSQSRTPLKNIIKVFPGPKRDFRDTPTELDAFLKMLSPEMIDDVLNFTNLFIENKRSNVKYSRERDSKDMSRAEFMATIGALILIGVKHGAHTNCKELWEADGTGMAILRALYSYKRFLFLIRCFRFDDLSTRIEREETDKLAAIRSIYTKFVANCRNSYSPGEFVTVDEMLLAFRGRCGFVQYMPLKPAKYGLKLYALCDCKTFYTWNFEIYAGKPKPGPYNLSNKPDDIVPRLCHGLEHSHRNVTYDNYHCSYPLSDALFEKGLTTLGTVKKNKRELPPEFMSTNRPVGSVLYGFQYDKTLISIQTKPKKCVVLLSTMHDRIETDEESGKQMMNADYNRTKVGVDVVDQMCAAYSSARISRRWPLALFFRFIDLAGINAQVIFFHNNPDEAKRRRFFLKSLAFQLMEPQLKIRAQMKSLPKDVFSVLENYNSDLLEQPRAANLGDQGIKKGPCVSCGGKKNRTSVRCDKCHSFVCKNHCNKIVKCNSCIIAEDLTE